LVGVACFLPGRAKDLSAPVHRLVFVYFVILSVCNFLFSFVFYFTHFISFHFTLFCLPSCIFPFLLLAVKCTLQYVFVFSSYWRGRSSELVQAVDRFITHTPLRNPHPTGSAKGCRGAARDILVVARAGHNTVTAPRQYIPLSTATSVCPPLVLPMFVTLYEASPFHDISLLIFL